jgi:hypothetical protein
VSPETVDQIAEQGAGRIAVRFRSSQGLKLNQGISGSDAALEFLFERIQFFPFLVPHEFHVADRAGVVEQQKEVLEKFQVLLELPPQSSAEESMLLFHAGPPDEEGLYYEPEADDIIKTKRPIV